MTYHSGMAWNIGDPVTQAIEDEVVLGIEHNFVYNKRMFYVPAAYHLGLNKIDLIIYNTSILLDRYFGHGDNKPEPDMDKLIATWSAGAPPGMPEAMKKIALKVIRRKEVSK
jgi:hypothetical protein